MDRFEQTIRRNDTESFEKDRAKYRVCFIIAIVFALGFIFFLSTTFQMLANGMKIQFMNVLPLLITAACAIGAFYYKDNMLIEYDYIVEDDTVTVAKIKNLSSRKELLVLPITALKRIEKYHPTKYSEFDGKKLDCSLNGEDKKYMLFYEHGEKGILLFEPNESLLKMLEKELN
jgi:hypothetical protein